MKLRSDALSIFQTALAAADPAAAVRRALTVDGRTLRIGSEAINLEPVARVWLVGAGKAATGMALGALDVLGERVHGGAICKVHGGARPLPPLDVWEASHPVPDVHSLAAAAESLRVARAAGAHDLVICLLSGGASALWAAPPVGVLLGELRATTEALLRAGATVVELNTVRKHLSRIAGGQLARAVAPARLVTLLLSDVVGSATEVIASGPTVPDPTTFADALEVLHRRGVSIPSAAYAHLQAGAAGAFPETPKPGDAVFQRTSAHVVASNRDAVDAAARAAAELGYRVTVVTDRMEGEARDVGEEVAALAWGAHAEGGSAGLPAAWILGGETTVTVRGRGRGGRSQELALAAAIGLEGEPDVVVLAAGTDGVDGPTRAAGALVDGRTVSRARELGLDAADHLARNDSHTLCHSTGDLVVTGPTGTNVGDLVIVLVGAPRDGAPGEAATPRAAAR